MVAAHPTNSAVQVANYFIKRAADENKPITNKKLQKLVYYAQVWSLVLNKEKLFREKMEAWVHGPVVPALYRKFMSFEANPITLDMSDATFSFGKKQLEVLDSVWSVYGDYDASYLEALTHSELPWQEARKDLPATEASNNEIDLKLARDFYAAKLGTEQAK
ncbi:SocA family protein [Candidatus Kaiserbacteria bacterium]|nr:SocA family protein [Candidatus Kaiserbacteria bacterium]